LQDTRIVSARYSQECVAACDAAWVTRRIVRASITTGVVVDAIPLSVIENVKGFRAELDRLAFSVNRKMFENSAIQIPARRIVQNIAAGVAKG
jgi:hypothetical protein